MKRYNFEYYDDAPHDSGMEENPKGEYVLYNDIPYLVFPPHSLFPMSACCGIFMEIREEGLFCNECGSSLEETIEKALDNRKKEDKL